MEAKTTRISIGSQLRQALNDLVEAGTIRRWTTANTPDGHLVYLVDDTVRTPGETIEMLNRDYACDIRFGKMTQGEYNRAIIAR